MTAMQIEVEQLTGIDLENTPPCSAVLVDFSGWIEVTKCPAPSAVRLRVTHECGLDERNFYCQDHADWIIEGASLLCHWCGQGVVTGSGS